MKMQELRQKNAGELATLIRTHRSRIDELRFLLKQKKVKDVKEISRLKKDVARALTLTHHL